MSHKPLLHKRSKILSIAILLSLIVIGEMARTFLGNGAGLKTQHNSRINLFVLFLSLQVIFAPLQAGLSDFYCRKKSIIFCLICITTSICISSLYSYRVDLLTLAALLFGIAGNLIPISRAGLLDLIFPHHNFRFYIGLSTVSIALGYCLSAILFRILPTFSLLLLIIVGLITGIFIAYFYFIDIKDTLPSRYKGEFSLSKEIYSLWSDFLKKPTFLLIFLTYFLLEIAFYEMFFDYTATTPESFFSSIIVMCLGYIVGALFIKTSTCSDETWIKRGLFCSFIALALFTCIPINRLVILRLTFFVIYSVGYGLFTPCLFSLLSKQEASHSQGRIYGIVDSFDAGALLISYLINGSFTKPIPHKSTFIHYENFIIPLLSISCFFVAVLLYNYRSKA
ncbi:MAG: MFS transporter [Chlamydiales bacterium]